MTNEIKEVLIDEKGFDPEAFVLDVIFVMEMLADQRADGCQCSECQAFLVASNTIRSILEVHKVNVNYDSLGVN
jgi:hypothetical protein